MTTTDSPEIEHVRAALAQFEELGGADFVVEMVILLNEQTPVQFAGIEKALAAGDIATAQRHAHSMKSSFGSFGATRCQELATNMDAAGKAGDADGYQLFFGLLKPEFARLQEILKNIGDQSV